MMNKSAKQTWELLTNNTGSPLAAEHLVETLLSFPILFSSVLQVTANEVGLCAIGYTAPGQMVMAWVRFEGESGYRCLPSLPSPAHYASLRKQPNILVRFYREARWRLGRAWDALCGREE